VQGKRTIAQHGTTGKRERFSPISPGASQILDITDSKRLEPGRGTLAVSD
jgi:hypothetical protein